MPPAARTSAPSGVVTDAERRALRLRPVARVARSHAQAVPARLELVDADAHAQLLAPAARDQPPVAADVDPAQLVRADSDPSGEAFRDTSTRHSAKRDLRRGAAAVLAATRVAAAGVAVELGGAGRVVEDLVAERLEAGVGGVAEVVEAEQVLAAPQQ